MVRRIFTRDKRTAIFLPTVAENVPDTILTDTFTGADNLILGSTSGYTVPDEIRGGGVWTGYDGLYDGTNKGIGSCWKITDNAIVAGAINNPGTYYGTAIPLQYSGTVTYTLMCAIKNVVASNFGLAFRKSGGDFLEARIGYNSSEKYYCYLVKHTTGQADSFPAGVSNITGTFETMVPLKIVDTGTNVKIYFNTSGSEATTLRIDFDTSDYAANRGIGPFTSYNSSPWPKFDTLVVT